MRQVLNETQIHSNAKLFIENFHPEVIAEIQKAILENEWVMVGMATNPFVKRARNHLLKRNLTFKYIEYGGYLSQWKKRLAIKQWSGWPTFPQVFHKGILIGGYTDLEKYLK